MAPITSVEAEQFVRYFGDNQRRKWEEVEDLRGAVERLLKIWYDPYQILIELLQNADDEGDEDNPNDSQFILGENYIIFQHHGHPFEKEHVEAISKINKTTKKPGSHIGYMGIGFKSVFKLTDTPYIFCEPFRFRFSRKDVIVPRWVEEEEVPEPVKAYLKPGWTTFYLPLNADMLKRKDDIYKKLTGIDPVTLVLLKKTNSITIKTDKETVYLRKENENPIPFQGGDKKCRKLRLKIREEHNGDERFHDFLVYETWESVDPDALDKEAIDSKRNELKEVIIILVFPLDSQGNFDIKKRPLYTFLPTHYDPGLRFVISSDFILDSSRGVPLWSSAWNKWLLKSVTRFLKTILEDFKNDENFKRKFYRILPRYEETTEPIKEYMTKELIEYCRNSPVVLTSNDQWCKPSECVVADEDLQSLIPPEKLGYQFYVSPRVEGKEILLNELKVREIKDDEEREILLNRLCDESWLTQQNTEWFSKFYDFLYSRLAGDKPWKITIGQNDLLNKLKQKPLIKTSRGIAKPSEAILPSSDDENQAITQLLDIVEPSLITVKTVKLFEMLEVKEAKDDKLISLILAKCAEDEWKNWSDEIKKLVLAYVKDWVLKRGEDIPEPIMEKLPNIIVPLRGGGWNKAGNSYLPDKRLEELIPNIQVVDDSLTENNDWLRFLELAKINHYPRIINIQKLPIGKEDPTTRVMADWPQYIVDPALVRVRKAYRKEESISNVKLLEGFDEALRTQDRKKLKHYLEYLYAHWDEYYSKHINSSYNWVTSSGYTREATVESYFYYQIKKRAWLPTSEGLKKPEEAFLPLKELRTVFGPLVPYVELPEHLLDKPSGLTRAIGINTEGGKEKLLFALKRAKDFKVDDVLKKYLENIYEQLARYAEGEQLSDVEILCEDGKFRKASGNIYWNDDPEVAEKLARPPPFAWVPPLARPRLEVLFKALGIRSLSESITRQIEPSELEKICDDNQLEKTIKDRLKYFYSILLDARVEDPQRKIELLKSLKVFRVRDIRYVARLGLESAKIEAKFFYDNQNNILYLRPEADPYDIAVEFIKVFHIPPVYTEYIRLVIAEDEQIIESRLKKGGVRIVSYLELSEAQVEQKVETIEREKIGEIQVTKPEIIYERKFETQEALEREAAAIFMREPQPLDLRELRNPPQHADIDKPVVSKPKYVISESKKPYAGLNLYPMQVDGMTLLAEPNLSIPPIEEIKKFVELVKKIVECMEGHPDRVMIIICDEHTDARDLSPTYPGKIGFNAALIDRTPIFWMIVAARELAALLYKEHYLHVKAMSQLLEKGLIKIHEIDPEFIKRIKPTHTDNNHSTNTCEPP